MIRKVKIVLVLMIAILLVSVLASTVVNAEEITDIDWATQITNMDSNAGTGEYGGDVTNTKTKIDSLMGKIIAAVRVIAVGVAIIMLTVLAMKYLMAAPGDKADIKKHAVVYVVGAVVLFGISGILGIIIEFSGNIKKI